jgi:hypothetical protein
MYLEVIAMVNTDWNSPFYLANGDARHVWEALFLLLILWWLPVIIHTISNLVRQRPVAERPVGAVNPVADNQSPVYYQSSKDLANIARDIFLAILGATLLAHFGTGITHGFMIMVWVATAIGIVWWSMSLLFGRLNFLSPLFAFLFAVAAITLFALGFRTPQDD